MHSTMSYKPKPCALEFFSENSYLFPDIRLGSPHRRLQFVDAKVDKPPNPAVLAFGVKIQGAFDRYTAITSSSAFGVLTSPITLTVFGSISMLYLGNKETKRRSTEAQILEMSEFLAPSDSGEAFQTISNKIEEMQQKMEEILPQNETKQWPSYYRAMHLSPCSHVRT